MASTRNNTVQDRRAALRERQRRERTAADAVFKSLDAEESARAATAAAVADLVDVVGAVQAAGVVGLEPRELTAYLNLHSKLNPTIDEAPTDDAPSDEASDVEDGDDAAASVPPQGGHAAPVGVGS